MEAQLTEYLYQHIPLSAAMGIKVENATTHHVILSAPLSKNINHKKTVFGGSLHASATLACWSLLYLNLRETANEPVQIVIAKSEVVYCAPVETDFFVECVVPDEIAWRRFIKMLETKKKGRIQLFAQIFQNGHLCVDYQAVFGVKKETS